MLTQGVVLSGRYLLSERVATGGMGAVWRCTDTLLDREVAVKVLLPSLVADPEFITRFHAEARMMASLRHPGIVAVHDFGQATLADDSQVSYLVMEYVEGEPLVTWIRRAGRLDPASTMSVVAQAAQALHAAHGAGIVHRDVKPGNLLVKRDGSVVLVDFGIARSSTIAGITAANMVLGTASYMSPEQAAGQPVSPATDIYALGAVAYYCLSGQPPFVGDNPLEVALRHVQDEPAPLPQGTPEAVAQLVARALAKSPRDRFASAAAMADAATDARDVTLASIPVPPRPPWSVPGPAVAGHPATPTGNPGPTGAGHPATPTGNPSPPSGFPAGQPHTGAAHPPSLAVQQATPPGAYPRRFVVPEPDGAPTREDPSDGPARRRRLALVGAAGAVLVVLVAVTVVAALRAGPDPAPQERTAALTVETAGAEPTEAGPVATGDTPKPRPGATTGAPSAPAGPTGAVGGQTGSGTSRPTAGTTTAAPGTTAPQPGPTTTTKPSKPNPYTAAQACGSGYQVIDSATLTSSNGIRQGRVYLLYNGGNGYNCVVTLKDSAVGERTAVSAYLEVKDRTRGTDSGSFQYYAGPVRASAAGACVKWGGSAGGVSYGSPFEHCG